MHSSVANELEQYVSCFHRGKHSNSISAYKVPMTVCTQERSIRISTDLNSGCLQRMGWGIPEEEEGLLTHTISPVKFYFYEYI